MRHTTLRMAAVLALTWSSMALAAVQAIAPPGPVAQPKREPRVVKMTVSAVAPGEPALRYRLRVPLLEKEPGNAATSWYLAIQQLGEAGKSDDAISELLEAPISQLTAEKFRGVDKPSAREFAAAAALRDDCAWGLNIRQRGFEALLPHLGNARTLSRLLALKARADIAAGDYPAAARSLAVGYELVDDFNNEPTLIQALVAVAVSEMLSRQVEAWIDAPDSPNLYWALANLPRPLVDLRKAMETERYALDFTFPQLRKARAGQISEQEFRDLLTKMPALTGQNRSPTLVETMGAAAFLGAMYPDAKKYVMQSQKLTEKQVDALPPHQVIAEYFVGVSDTMFDDMVKWMALPYWQAAPGIRETEANLRKPQKTLPGMLVQLLAPAVLRATEHVVLADRKVASLMCVEAIRAYAAANGGKLPASLDQITATPVPLDPITGKAFSYEVQGQTAILNVPGPEGQEQRGWRYEITIGK